LGPSGKLRIRVSGAITFTTFPWIVLTVVTVFGVSVVGDGALQLHSRFEIVDAEFLPVDGSAGRIRYVEIPNNPAIHFDNEVVTGHIRHFPTLYLS
jgi:hypothetical protein